MILGPKTVICQRYGAGPKDNRSSFMTFLMRKQADSIFDEIGIQRPNSRKSSILTGSDLQKVKTFLHGEFDDDFDQSVLGIPIY